MLRIRRIGIAWLTVVLLAGFSLHVTAWASMIDNGVALAGGAAWSDDGCEGCGEDGREAAACAAVCAGMVAVLPAVGDIGPPLRPGFPAASTRSAHGQAWPPATSPPNSILG